MYLQLTIMATAHTFVVVILPWFRTSVVSVRIMALRWSAGLLSFDSLLPCRMANHLLPLDAALRMPSTGAAHGSQHDENT